MTEEELFKIYIKREVCAHCSFPQFCKGKGEKNCSDIAIIKRHYLAGVEAGKSQAETEKEKCELLGIIQGKDKVIQELKKELNSMLVSKNQQL